MSDEQEYRMEEIMRDEQIKQELENNEKVNTSLPLDLRYFKLKLALMKLTITKDHKVEFKSILKYKYADLSSVMSAIDPILSEHGFYITEKISQDDGLNTYVNTKLHAIDERFFLSEKQKIDRADMMIVYSGSSRHQDWECRTLVRADGMKWHENAGQLVFDAGTYNQQVGAGITYNRRYNLLTLLSLVPEDSDGVVPKQQVPLPVEVKDYTKYSDVKIEGLIKDMDDISNIIDIFKQLSDVQKTRLTKMFTKRKEEIINGK